MRHFLIAFFLLFPGFAVAQSVQDQIVSQLTAQGFTRIEVSRTLLGRVKIEARSASLERELVFNPVTGEILRDYWQDSSSGAAAPRVLVPGTGRDDKGGGTVASSSSGSGNGGSSSSSSGGRDDDRAGDDRSGRGDGDDDRDDDDRSGSGSGGSDDDSGRGRGRGRGGDDNGDDD